jgi:hypothetical protein
VENVKITVEGEEIVIRMDKNHRNDVGNKKTVRVGSTLGNKQVNGLDIFIGVNAYVYRNSR